MWFLARGPPPFISGLPPPGAAGRTATEETEVMERRVPISLLEALQRMIRLECSISQRRQIHLK
jgi:hypothetical protein